MQPPGRVIREFYDEARKLLKHELRILNEEEVAVIAGSFAEIVTARRYTCPGWKVFLHTREDMERTIRYVENNPVKIGRPVQRHDFVKPYDGWLPRVGARRKM